MKVAIVGAGMAGLAAARTLADAGVAVTVFEKSRGVGGRMSTRREPPGAFDHGAQYFTVRDPRFARAVAAWTEAGVVRRRPGDRFVGAPGMSSVCGHLGRGLEVRTGARVTDLAALDGFDARLVAVPAPQAEPLLGVSFEGVRMEPCHALMGVLPRPVDLRFEDALEDEAPLSWIALHGDRFVLHATPEWSAAHFDDPPERVRRAMLDAVPELPEPTFVRLHRWRYARVTQPLGEPCVWDADRRIGACGDWCLGARVEAAYLSGVALAESVLS